MRRKTFFILLVLIAGFIQGCNNRSGKEYSDMETLLKDLSRYKSVEFNKYPPRLVKAFLRMEKSNNEGLIQLLEISKMFVVVHIPKDIKGSVYHKAVNEVDHHISKNNYEKIKELDFENIDFREYFHLDDSFIKELVLEIDEPELYTVYCLKGDFTREDIIRVSNKVSPVEFLKLNRKIRKK